MKRKNGYSITTRNQRFSTGCVATLTDGVSRHFTGEGADSTRAVADYCDKHGLRVVCLSTPATVYRDLQGGRWNDNAPERARVTSSARPHEGLALPEPRMLAAIGRTDLLAVHEGEAAQATRGAEAS